MADAKAVKRALFRSALRQGKDACEAGRPVTACPYPPGMLRVLFVRGYVAARQPEPAAQVRRRSRLVRPGYDRRYDDEDRGKPAR